MEVTGKLMESQLHRLQLEQIDGVTLVRWRPLAEHLQMIPGDRQTHQGDSRFCGAERQPPRQIGQDNLNQEVASDSTGKTVITKNNLKMDNQ